jgi:Ca2+-transporting ATPase
VLDFTYREYEKLPETLESAAIEKDLIFVGLMGMMDPARQEAYEAIRVCKAAGIYPVMITGDYQDTAVAVASELSLMRDKIAFIIRVITGGVIYSGFAAYL